MRNVDPIQDFGETQIAAKVLTCGDENKREPKVADQVIFAVRVISTYVTFYRAEIPAEYWKELGLGLPQKQSIVINRWPGENHLKSGLDLAEPDGRRAVLTALTKIRQSLLRD